MWTNPHNLCYMNATLRCLLWAVQGYVCSAEAFGRIGAAAVRALASKVAPTNIFELRNWKPLLEAWISPSAQHDCAEFLSHVGDRLNSSLLQGCWEARVLEGDRVRVLDTGRCLATIGLDLPAGDSHDLQELIGQWHAQYSAHALHTPPQVLVLRIARYRRGATGVVKNHSLVSWPKVVGVPYFIGSSLAVCPIRYNICAATYHEGPELTSGHYTCTLHDATQDWFCDDGVMPVPQSRLPTDMESASRRVYLFWLVLDQRAFRTDVSAARDRALGPSAHRPALH